MSRSGQVSGLVGSEEQADPGRSPSLPELSERMSVVIVAPPHPSLLDPDDLLAECGFRAQRRSGPGGQHRNKTSSGVFLAHEPTGVVAEATERRSQADNKEVALERLRYRLAIDVRTPSILDDPSLSAPREFEIRGEYRGSTLKLGSRNRAKPALIALLLNDLHASGGQPSAVAPAWKTTTSAVVRLIRSHPPAFVRLNQIRQHHGRGPLK